MGVESIVKKMLIVILGLILSSSVLAVDTPTVLPAGIRSVVLKRGSLSGLNEYYTGSGQLNYLSELNSIELDVKNLVRLEPQVKEFVSVLNSFGTFELGNQLHLGQLTVDARPEITYYAPMFLYGKTKRLTLGVAVPIIQYKNDIIITQRGSNISELHEEFSGASSELDAAFEQLNRDMTKEFKTTVSEKGYDSLDDIDEQYFGDVTLISAYQLPKQEKWINTVQLFLGLPTGPKPDADSLTDLETFGRWTAQSQLISEYRIHSKIRLLSSLSYHFTLPEKVEKRVPLDENDSLPDKNQKMNLTSSPGDAMTVFLGALWVLTPNVTAASAFGVEQKFKDRYSGAPGNREQYLEAGTEREARIGKLELNYSSVQDYLRGTAILPASIGYEISQILSGVNIENQTRHEVTFSVYF